MANSMGSFTTSSSPNGISEVCSRFIIETAPATFRFKNILKNTDEWYTFTSWVKTFSNTTGSFTIGGESFSVNSTWKKIVVTFKKSTSLNLDIKFNNATTFYFYHSQLEAGLISSDWTPSPEDTDDKISEVKTVANQTATGFNWLVSGNSTSNFEITENGINAITSKFTIKDAKGTSTVISGGSITTNNINSSDGKSWINLGNGTFNYNGKLVWNGSTLTVDGTVTAGSGSKIGGFNISDTAIYNGISSVSASSGTGVYVGTDGINVGGGKFKVTSAGVLTATDGTIGGWHVGSDGMYRGETASTNPFAWFWQKQGSGNMYFGLNGFSISDKFSIDKDGTIISKKGTIGGWEIGENYIAKLSSSSTKDNPVFAIKLSNETLTANSMDYYEPLSWKYNDNSYGSIYCNASYSGMSITQKVKPTGSTVTTTHALDISAQAQRYTWSVSNSTTKRVLSYGDVGFKLQSVPSSGTASTLALIDFDGYGYTRGFDSTGTSYTLRPIIGTSVNNGGKVAYIVSSGTNVIQVGGQWNVANASYTGKNINISSSDIRLKENIKPTQEKALPIVNSIKMYEFDWKQENSHQRLGFIADYLEKIDPRFTVGGGYNDDGAMNVKAVDTFYLVGYLTKAIQELSAEVDRLKELKGVK